MSKRSFELYAPLKSGLRRFSRLALFQNFLLIVRRMTLLYMAMFLPDKLWLQLIALLCCSLFTLNYQAYVRPFESYFFQILNKSNEEIMLQVVYLVTCVAAFPDSSTEIGAIIVFYIFCSWLINGLVVLGLVINEIYRKLRRLYLSLKTKKKLQAAAKSRQ